MTAQPALLVRDGDTARVARSVDGVLVLDSGPVALSSVLAGLDLPSAVTAQRVVDTVRSVSPAGDITSVAHRDRLREVVGPYVVDVATFTALASVPGAAEDPVAALLSLDIPTVAVPA